MRKFWRFISDNAAPISAVAAMLAAFFSWAQIRSYNQERLTPFRAALYTAKVDSFKDYARASSRYDAAIRKAMYDVPNRVNEPEYIEKRTDDEWREIARATNFVIDQHALLIGEMSAVNGLWPEDTFKLLVNAQNASTALADCYSLIGGKPNIPMADEWRAQLRAETAERCGDMHVGKQLSEYVNATNLVLESMRSDIRTVELGQLR